MRRSRTLLGLLSLSLVLALSVVVAGQRQTKPAPEQPIPLTVKFYTTDAFAGPTAVRGYPGGDGVEYVEYVDRQNGVDAYISRENYLWFHLRCTPTWRLVFTFPPPALRDPAGTYTFPDEDVFNSMTTVRITTSGLSGAPDFRAMKPGTTYQTPLMVQFWTPVDEFAWSLHYGGAMGFYSQSSVDVEVAADPMDPTKAGKWTLTPKAAAPWPAPATEYAWALFSKYVRPKNVRPPGIHHDLGVWRMPFKIVLEKIQ